MTISTSDQFPEKITFDGVEYQTDSLSDVAKFCLADILYLDESISSSQRDLVLLEAAKERITEALESELS